MAGEPQTAECPLARALRMPVSIECDHGYDVGSHETYCPVTQADRHCSGGDECPGFGKCHGCAAWCAHCGDVGETCNAPGCMVHRCRRCDVILTDEQKEFDRDYWMWCFACSVRIAMETARDAGDDELAAGEHRQAQIDGACGRR